MDKILDRLKITNMVIDVTIKNIQTVKTGTKESLILLSACCETLQAVKRVIDDIIQGK